MEWTSSHNRVETARFESEHMEEFRRFRHLIQNEAMEMRLRRGQFLYRQGDPRGKVFLIEEGWVALERVCPLGSRQILDMLVPKSCILSGFGRALPATHRATCLTDTKVSVLAFGSLRRMMQDNHEFLDIVMAIYADTQERTFDHLANIGCRPGIQRVAHLLADLHDRAKAGDIVNPEDIPVCQNVIADAVGLTPVYANKVLKQMRQAKIIELRKGKPVIANLLRLRRLAETGDGLGK